MTYFPDILTLGMSESEESNLKVLIFVFIIIAYITFQAVIEHKKITIIHETGFGILLGVAFGFLIFEEDHREETVKFNGENFFIYILPPIIFAAGYNLKKDKFFKNMFYIVLYAVLGTIVNFIITLFIMIGFNDAGWIYRNDGTPITMSSTNILYFAATMCASDAIAALTLINSDKYPKLFSIVFGEGLLNDAVAIILFHSVTQIVGEGSDTISVSQAFKMVGSFFTTCIFSVLIGLIIGLFITWFFKVCRFFYHNAMTENVLILLFGYLSYIIAEVLDQSGVIAMLTSGILMSHYLTYNLSPSGVISSSITLSTISSVAEAFLFIYLGISFWQYFEPNEYDHFSFGFMGLGFLAVLIARCFCIFGTSGLAYLCKGKNWKLNMYELSIIWFTGMIRGAVAFALIQTVNSGCPQGFNDCSDQEEILKSSIMGIVFFTTIVLGAFMPCYVNVHIKQIEKIEQLALEKKAREEEEEEQQALEQRARTMSIQSVTDGIKDSLLVNNFENELEQQEKFNIEKEKQIKQKYKSNCIRFVKTFDERMIKPFLIYDYEKRKIEIEKKKQLIRKKAAESNDNKNQAKTLTRLQNEEFMQRKDMDAKNSFQVMNQRGANKSQNLKIQDGNVNLDQSSRGYNNTKENEDFEQQQIVQLDESEL